MDNDRRPRQTLAGYAGQQGNLLPPQASYPVVSASDRFRQAPLTAQPPTSAPASGGRASASSGAQSYGYAYGEGSQFVGSSIQQPGVSYGGDYASDAQPAQRASQHYQPYGQSAMYSAQAPATATSQYEGVQPYQQNREAIEVLGTNFGVAQPQYYGGVPSEGGPTSAPATAIATQNVPSQYPPLGYTAQQAPVGRESLAPAYTAAAMTDPHQPTASGAYGQPAYGEQTQHGSGNEYDDFYNNYQAELKKTFEYIRDGRLDEAAPQLFRLSDWLLHWAETLVRDDEAHQQQRLKLWEEFNHCWLTLLQKQKDLVAESLSVGRNPQPPQSLVKYEFLEKMGTQLVKNCDNMEKHGLVDYQMGVWEEEIIAMVTSCLDQLEEVGHGPPAQRPAASSSRR
ncbi:hypothetical protein K458DRAFT_39772 [Lentithecium fluviatile CBS 122367]|uniref:Uncharacterized protein n=1 Tax=Lentithecium fluviatile CBS 122367 TaxID=1168545 RepID=A0A6G1IZC6_9PLEO|nr:hypothetical protein K458DRAFT_39772 [Lentithecium fluviatile CBS 122367]